jgi:hypothetical protein
VRVSTLALPTGCSGIDGDVRPTRWKPSPLADRPYLDIDGAGPGNLATFASHWLGAMTKTRTKRAPSSFNAERRQRGAGMTEDPVADEVCEVIITATPIGSPPSSAVSSEDRLAAAGNAFPIRSIYRREGTIQLPSPVIQLRSWESGIVPKGYVGPTWFQVALLPARVAYLVRAGAAPGSVGRCKRRRPAGVA